MDLQKAIYLDYNATTPVAPEVVNEMLPYFLSAYGNPSSNDHILGWQAKEVIENARETIANILGLDKEGIIYTSGATEAINLALRGFFLNDTKDPKHLITLQTEHSAVLETCRLLESKGIEVTYLPVKESGLVDLNELTKAFKEHTKMVCIMMVNNETGVRQPLNEIVEICHSQEVIIMSDTTQALGKSVLNNNAFRLDILVGSAHKFYGPMGVGILYIKDQLRGELQPLIAGGKQEGGKRAGTINVPGIVGMSKALELASDELDKEAARIGALRDEFEAKLIAKLDIKINGVEAPRIYNTSNIVFYGVDSEKLMQAIGAKIAASRGSACTYTRIEPTHVLMAMGLSEQDIFSSIRFSLGRYTSAHEIEIAVDTIIKAVDRLKA